MPDSRTDWNRREYNDRGSRSHWRPGRNRAAFEYWVEGANCGQKWGGQRSGGGQKIWWSPGGSNHPVPQADTLPSQANSLGVVTDVDFGFDFGFPFSLQQGLVLFLLELFALF